MALPEDDLSASQALVIDSSPASRSILASQSRDFGMGVVVLCERHFDGEALSGQDLLDDLRRNQLLPFSTVFIMVTGEATCAKVAEDFGAAAIHEPYAVRVRAAHAQILKLTEYAMSLSMGGDPQAAVRNLIFHGNSTCNGKLIETAHLVLHRYAEKIEAAQGLSKMVQNLRTRFSTSSVKPALGEQTRASGVGSTVHASP